MQSAKEKNLKFAVNKDEQISLFQDNNGLTLNPNFLYEKPAKIMPKYLNNLDDLHVGDKIKVTIKHTKRTFMGYFETKGFHDGRDQGNFRYYYLKVIQEDGEEERTFREFFNDSEVELLESYKTTGYQSPKKSEVAKKLKERLKNAPFDNYISIYQELEKEYPYLSYEWRPIIRGSWESLPLEIAGEEEVLNYFKKSNKQSGWKIGKPLKKVFEDICMNYVEDERIEQLKKIRWIEKRSSYDIVGNYRRVSFKDYTYFNNLKQHIIKNTKNVDLFLEVISSMHPETRYLTKEDIVEPENAVKNGKLTVWESTTWKKTSFVPYMQRNKDTKVS